MTKEEAKILRSQKDNLQMMIFKCTQLKHDAKRLVIEYHKIVDELVKNGYKVYIRAPYLKLEYWGLTPKDVYKSPILEQSTSGNEQNKYIIKLAWVDSESITNYIQKLNDYMVQIGLEKIEEEFNDTLNGKECIIKYKYIGENEAFKLLKRMLNEHINIFCGENSQIAIFGSKQNF